MFSRQRMLTLFTGAACCAMAGTAGAAVDKVICVPWQGDVNKQHTILSGVASVPAQLKCVVKTTDTSPVYYKWVFGDGSADSAVTTLSGSQKYNVETSRVYTAATETPFTAKLQVSNSNSPFAMAKEDPYLMKVHADDISARINIAIDTGLWFLYKQGNVLAGYASYPHTYDNSSFVAWLQTSYVYTLATPTASAVHAFGINGHKIKGNPDEDPYVESVKGGMNYLVQGYNLNTTYPALQGVAISPESSHPADNPDANGNGYGIQVYDWQANHVPYQAGQIMDAIIASGVAPADSTGRDFAPGTSASHTWTYGELLQDMADMHAWGQNDAGTCNGGICGSWWYGWNYGSPGDNSASQWPAIGMLPAQQAPWNVIVPQWVKTYNANWLAYSMGCTGTSSAVTACTYDYFSYNGVGGCAGDNCQQTTTSGMVQMIMDAQTTSDLKWQKAQKRIADQWKSFTHDGSTWSGPKIYGWYSFAKAMRLALPAQVTQIVKTSGATFDWYYGNPANAACSNEATCEQGMAPRILEVQTKSGANWGAWVGTGLTNPPLTTAWMVITLRPTLFAAAPIACFKAAPNPSYPNVNVSFDPSCSSHSETGKTIANLTKFEWDWDNNGTYDVSSATPAVQAHPFACASLPCTYPVTLRVTDDNNPALQATTVVNVVVSNPPHPPVAEANGPYMVSSCQADTLTLDGSKSYDPNAGQHETNCTTCPDDGITAYDWDLVAPLTFDVINTAGVKPLLSSAQVATFFSLGTHDIGLRVTDNTALAYPGSGQPNLTNADFSSVNYVSGCICNLAARAKSGKIQLTWAAVNGASTYDIYRSTVGGNAGFAKIASGVATTYATYLDASVVNGTTYYYRVVANTGCGSNAASAVATAR